MKFDFAGKSFLECELNTTKLAVDDGVNSFCWQDLKSEVAKLTEVLLKLSIPKHHPIIIYSNESILHIVALLACYTNDYIFVPISNKTPIERLKFIKETLNSEVIISTTNTCPAVEFKKSLIYNNNWQVIADNPTEFKCLNSDLIYIIFTSGTSGYPKAVPISNKNLTSFLNWHQSSAMATTPEDVCVNSFSLNFDGSLILLLTALATGASFLHNFSVADLQSVAKHNPSIWAATPSLLLKQFLFAGFNASAMPSLGKFIIGGETLLSSTAQLLKQRFPLSRLWNNYGPTEATICVSAIEITDSIINKYTSMPIANLKSNLNLKLARKHIEQNKTFGEIIISGNSVSNGYIESENSNFFYDANGNWCFNSGDIAFAEDELLFYFGRNDSQIKLHGYRIDLTEIEQHVLKSGQADECVCLPLSSNQQVKKIVCFYTSQIKNSEDSKNNILQYLLCHLPDYLLPHQFVKINTMPLTNNSKIDKQKLLQIYSEQ